STSARPFVRKPPNVKVNPPVTLYAQKGGVAIGCAKFVFGGFRERHLPSRIEALYSWTVAKKSSASISSFPARDCRLSASTGAISGPLYSGLTPFLCGAYK